MKIIFSTNDILQAKRIAQHILFLSNGKLIESLDAKTFFQKPRFKKIEKLLRGVL